MEKQNFLPSIFCSIHPKESIQRIDLAPEAKKQLYCNICLLESDDPKSLFSRLPTFEQAITSAVTFYSSASHKIKANPDTSSYFSRQGEALEQLTRHINQEKDKIEEIFSALSANIMKIINQAKSTYLQLLDDKLIKLCNQYVQVENQVRAVFLQQEELVSAIPSKEDVEARLSKVADAAGLDIFVNSLKSDMAKGKDFDLLEGKRKVLDSLLKDLEEMETCRPVVERENFNVHDLENTIKEELDKYLTSKLMIKDPKGSNKFPESSILTEDDFGLVKEWMSEKYIFQPKLLYRGSRDGMGANVFHAKCDKMGPTITVIKSKFRGYENSNVIGGFLDKDWETTEKYASSDEAFIFSVTQKVKCPIVKQEFAAKLSKIFGPTFGGDQNGHEMYIPKTFKNASFRLGSYANSFQIIDKNYKGPGCDFVVEEIEVYSISKI